MQQILLILNANDLNNASINFGAHIARLTKSRLVALFLQQKQKANTSFHQVFALAGDEEVSDYSNTAQNELQQKNVELFKNICMQNSIRSSFHFSQNNSVEDIIKESRFSDLIITDGQISFSGEISEETPSAFTKDLLAGSECPVIIAPFKFEAINEIVFTYDGSKSSVFAIKQFACLFPSLDEAKITLIQITPDDVDEFTESEKLKKWLMTHYNAVHLEILHGIPDEELFKKLVASKNKMLVMGAYGRKPVLQHSTADIILKNIDIPVFIAHQ